MESMNALCSNTAYLALNLDAFNRASMSLCITAAKSDYNVKALNYE